MFGFIGRKLRYAMQRYESQEEPEQFSSQEQEPEKTLLSTQLSVNLELMREKMGTSSDIKVHDFRYGHNSDLKGALVYVDGLVQGNILTQSVLKPLMMSKSLNDYQSSGITKTLDIIKQTVLCSSDVTERYTIEDAIDGCLSGDTVFLSEGFDKALIINSKGWEKRSVSEPQSESVVRGPREGFTEDFRTNTALLRRRIKSSSLRMDHLNIGKQTSTNICLVYIDGIANPDIVSTVKTRLKSIDTDAILDTGYIEQYIEDRPLSLFSTIGYTEKPDVVAARVLEGRIAVLADGSPFALTAPMLFVESFQTSEDYYIRPFFANLTRLLRYFAFFIAVFTPAIFVALTTHHQEMIPTTLLFTIAAAREGTPFPAIMEALIMVFSFEVLREAGLRLPRPIGQAISIVGALIMGDAAVSAGLVGAPMVIAVALTAVAGFVVPEQNDTAAILRLIMLMLAASLGGYGIAMGLLGMMVHLASLHSFGVPYCASMTFTQNMQDSYIRVPLWMMKDRPTSLAQGNIKRSDTGIPPLHPAGAQEVPPEETLS